MNSERQKHVVLGQKIALILLCVSGLVWFLCVDFYSGPLTVAVADISISKLHHGLPSIDQKAPEKTEVALFALG